MTTLGRIIDDVTMKHIVLYDKAHSVDVRFYVALRHYPLDTYAAHARRLNVSEESLRKARRRLEDAGWVYTAFPPERRRGAWVVPWMPPHVEEEIVAQMDRLRQEIHFYGEWMMKCLLDLSIHERKWRDNARPEWLLDPDTGRRLELDRWYRRAKLAFEFQGPQHFGPDGRIITTETEFAAQARRDQVKRELCRRHGVELLEVTAADLSFPRLTAMIKEAQARGVDVQLFPLREESVLVRELTGMAHSYAARMRDRSR